LAVQRNIRDTPAQAWLFTQAAIARDFEGAMEHLDALLRTRPALVEPLLPILVELVGEPDAVPAIAATLAQNPPWRARFLGTVSQKAPQPASLAGLFTSLKATSAPPSGRETSMFLWRLVNREQYELAYLNWIMLLPGDRL